MYPQRAEPRAVRSTGYVYMHECIDGMALNVRRAMYLAASRHASLSGCPLRVVRPNFWPSGRATVTVGYSTTLRNRTPDFTAAQNLDVLAASPASGRSAAFTHTL